MDKDRISHNTVIKSDLEDAGYNVRWNMNDGLIVSLNRRVLLSGVRTALFLAGYEEGQFTAHANENLVIVDAVC